MTGHVYSWLKHRLMGPIIIWQHRMLRRRAFVSTTIGWRVGLLPERNTRICPTLYIDSFSLNAYQSITNHQRANSRYASLHHQRSHNEQGKEPTKTKPLRFQGVIVCREKSSCFLLNPPDDFSVTILGPWAPRSRSISNVRAARCWKGEKKDPGAKEE